MRYIHLLVILMVLLIPVSCFAHQATLTVVYNNVPFNKDMILSWGFGCVVEGFEKSILFDTGGDGGILLSNMGKCGIHPTCIDTVVLSHIHHDHLGGLPNFLAENGGRAEVYFPESFPMDFRERVSRACKRSFAVGNAIEICPHVWSTGELGSFIREQSLVLDTPGGLVIITGCAHPGIVEMAVAARKLFEREIYLVLGGFHLTGSSDNKIRAVIEGLKDLGVKKVAPSHCTGDRAIQLFREAWGEDFLELGCGANLSLELW